MPPAQVMPDSSALPTPGIDIGSAPSSSNPVRLPTDGAREQQGHEPGPGPASTPRSAVHRSPETPLRNLAAGLRKRPVRMASGVQEDRVGLQGMLAQAGLGELDDVVVAVRDGGVGQRGRLEAPRIQRVRERRRRPEARVERGACLPGSSGSAALRRDPRDVERANAVRRRP